MQLSVSRDLAVLPEEMAIRRDNGAGENSCAFLRSHGRSIKIARDAETRRTGQGTAPRVHSCVRASRVSHVVILNAIIFVLRRVSGCRFS